MRIWTAFGRLLMACAFAPAATSAGEFSLGRHSIGIGPAPQWIEPAVVRFAPPPVMSTDHGPQVILLEDYQADARRDTFSVYRRSVRRLRSTSHLEEFGRFEESYDPVLDRFELHHIDIIRDGERVSRIDRARLRLLEREAEADRGIYDGSVAVNLELADVRVGDVLDAAWSVIRRAPAGQPRLDILLPATHTVPVDTWRLRLLVDGGRQFTHHARGMPIESGSQRFATHDVYTWTAHDLPGFRNEGRAPEIVAFDRSMQISDWGDWRQVASDATVRIAPAEPVDGDRLAPLVDRWRSEAATPEARAMLAINFVQDEIRYVSIALGEGAWRARAPRETLTTRFGDCKDKSVLLVALLGRLGIDAVPALVSTEFNGEVERFLPTPRAFDHVIVRIRIGDREYWIDPTLTGGPSNIDRLSDLGYGLALPVVPGAELVRMNSHSLAPEQVVARDDVAIAADHRAATLTATVRSHGSRAESLRRQARAKSPEDFRQLVGRRHLHGLGPGASVSAFEFSDDRHENVLTYRVRIEVPEFLTADANGRFLDVPVYSAVVDSYVPREPAPNRRLPYLTGTVVRVEHVIDIAFPRRLDVDLRRSAGSLVDSPRMYFAHSVAAHDWRFEARFEFARKKAVVESGELADFARELRATARDLDQTLRIAAAPFARPAELGDGPAFLERMDTEIASGQHAGAALSQRHTDRALQLSLLGRHDEALEGLRIAQFIGARRDEVLVGQARVLVRVGRIDEALAALNESITVNAESAPARFARARLLFLRGEHAAAHADLQAALKGPGPAGTREMMQVWRELVAQRLGLSSARRPPPRPWPGPILEMLVGGISPDDLLTRARNARTPIAQRRECEAWFFIGQFHLGRGEHALAESALRAAIQPGMERFDDSHAARITLAGMGIHVATTSDAPGTAGVSLQAGPATAGSFVPDRKAAGLAAMHGGTPRVLHRAAALIDPKRASAAMR